MSKRNVFNRFRLWLKYKRQPVAELVVSAPDKHVAIAIVLSTCADVTVVRVLADRRD